MPSHLPSSFASAAAGQNTSRDARGGTRTDGRGNSGGDWSRQGRSTNGTLTFRRTSTTPSSQTSSQMQASTESIHSTIADPTVISAMPVGSTNVESSTNPPRYSRDQLLSVFASQQQPNTNQTDVTSLFLPGWNPGHVNGTSTRGWGKSADTHPAPQEPDLCWDSTGSVKPVGLQEMSPEEKELFETDVNSAPKQAPQNKEANHQAGAMNGRKPSISHAGSNNFGVHSPSSASRPATRRRETTDTNPFSGGGGLVSPTSATRPPRDDPAYWFNRKTTDLKDSEPDDDTNSRDASHGKSLPFGALLRNSTSSGTAGLAPSSPWQATSPGGASGMGMGSFGNFAHPASAIGEKRPGATRGESRLAHLIPKDSSDGKKEEAPGADLSRPWRSRPRTDTDPFGGENMSGSAVLGGAQDTSPPPMTHAPLRNQEFDTPMKGSAGDFGMSGLNLGGHSSQDNEPLSPSETNPFRSPPGDRGEHDDGGDKSHAFGGMSEHASGFGNFQRAFGHAAFDGSDRSQTSSVGAKAYPPLGNLTGWPSSGTPDRERGAGFPGFGGSLFGPVGDIQSPSLGSLSGVFGPTTTTGLGGGSGSIGRGSKLGSLFPAAMQAQMHAQDDNSLSDSLPDLRQNNPLGAIGRNPLVDHVRETESPLRANRGVFDMFSPPEQSRTPGTTDPLHGGISAASQSQAFTPTTNAPFSATQASEPPSAQARTMVMPDRMRWVYLDPQGNQQGPFTGLEMNDWYKAQFFTPNLRVKKLEDAEFEPLGQLIRRIGNSREPFLVPQIGIPHGPPSQTGPFSPSAGGVIQPPLVNAFPSFGRTLTAEEQNNLERRKQEEQYIIARHRELMANHARMQVQGGVPGLHHHSSAHSLQSQPSFGSMTSPVTMPPQPPIGAIGSSGSFLDSQTAPAGHGNAGASRDLFRDEELAHLSESERQLLAGLQNKGGIGTNMPQQQHQALGITPSDGNLRSHLPGTGDLAEDEEGFRGRLQEFEQLRAQRDSELAEQHISSAQQEMAERNHSPSPSGRPVEQQHSAERSEDHEHDHRRGTAQDSAQKQYQQAQAAAAAAKLSGLPMPFPPPQSGTPLPAPAPQRVKSNLPEQYATSSRPETPELAPSSATAQPPPLAPWAKDTASESHKGPSLKEIQAAEAAKAAKAEEAAAIARRAMLEQEAAREREKAANATAAPGLPTTSTWGTASPANAGPAGSPWAKPATVKSPVPGTSATAQTSDKKKTLADIQREEEARKQKAAKDIAVHTNLTAAASKRYADLASKPNATSPSQPASAGATASAGAGWATVGAGGKVKVPTGPTFQARAGSTPNIKTSVAATNSIATAPSKPVSKPANPSTGNAKSEAMDEFNKWLHSQLSRGITGITDINVFASTLLELPAQADLIADAVYANSKTMDGRHFAQEFIRRKKLADKGVVERSSQLANSPAGDSSANSSGGWNEVAKKSNHKESTPSDANIMQGAGFKVVPSRKKGKK